MSRSVDLKYFAILVISELIKGLHVQLAISLFSCIYFLNDKMKNLLRASTTGY